jgi:hypothetical protein
MKVASLKLIYDTTINTERPQKVSGVIGDPVANLSSLRSSSPVTVDAGGLSDLRESNIIQTLTDVFWIFVEGSPDILIGDHVLHGSDRYIVRLVQGRGLDSVLVSDSFTRLTVERLNK